MRADTDIAVTKNSGIADCMDGLFRNAGNRRPRATYRLQFHRGFTLRDAIRLLPYFAELGISHIYASPLLQARASSTHGYDIVSHEHLNPEIGSEEDLRSLVNTLRERNMGLILDTVPNHMGVGFGDNPWWQDVLENGRAAEHANFFDIDWNPLKPELHDKVLLPVLGESYGEALDAGKIRLDFDQRFFVSYYDRRFPVDPQTIPFIVFETLRRAHPNGEQSGPAAELDQILQQLTSLPQHNERDPVRVTWRNDLSPRLTERMRELAEASAFVRTLLKQSADELMRDTDRYHAFLERQAYRLAFWRVSAEEINYRRFFDINDLVGLRMENPAVFAKTHHLLRRLLAEGLIDGIRIDHLDGMLNPRQYLTRVQMLYAASQCVGAEPQPPLAPNGIEVEVQNTFGQRGTLPASPMLYCVVEKILEPGEQLPEEWPVDGTSGYEFANLLSGVFMATGNEGAFTRLYHRVLGRTVNLDDELYHAKKVIMHSALAGEVNVLAHMLEELAGLDRHARDFTRKALRDAIRETIACFPIYRTYIDERGEITDRDRVFIAFAARQARRRNAGTARAVFDFLQSTLLLGGDEPMRPQQLQFTLKFQQLTGPVMAKGLEDTVCYTYNRFVGSNEVGGSPSHFGFTLDEFHRANSVRSQKWPHGMLASSTHDTKRSEDVRARLAVLSEIPQQWSQQVMRWKRTNASLKTELEDGRIAPDPNEEYLLYQTLVGTWEFGAVQPSETYIDRMLAYIEKAMHEAKTNLSWINPDEEYAGAVRRFIQQIMQPRRNGAPNFFVRDLANFVQSVQFHGGVNSVSQTLLKATAPGVPDFYQGCDLLDLSLVDPDNRRPVDFSVRKQILDSFATVDPLERSAACQRWAERIHTGEAKLWVTQRALCLRKDHPDVFRGDYLPVHAAGSRRDHVIAFAREYDGSMAITVAPRFTHTLMKGRIALPVGENWTDTELLLPPNTPAVFENVLTGELLHTTAAGTLPCQAVLRVFPSALLVGRG